jgi:hypothetical protein
MREANENSARGELVGGPRICHILGQAQALGRVGIVVKPLETLSADIGGLSPGYLKVEEQRGGVPPRRRDILFVLARNRAQDTWLRESNSGSNGDVYVSQFITLMADWAVPEKDLSEFLLGTVQAKLEFHSSGICVVTW